MAVIPSEGKLLSPVDGEIISVADTKHAYGLRTAEGLELLIHVGLETVHLNGECFQVFVKPGDKVKAGDLLAEVDLAYLKERGINPITPVLVCGGFHGQQLNAAAGPVQAGKTVLMELRSQRRPQTTQKKHRWALMGNRTKSRIRILTLIFFRSLARC